MQVPPNSHPHTSKASIVERSTLTFQQSRFVDEHLKLGGRNASEAYRIVYPGVKPEAAWASASRLLAMPKIKAAINERLSYAGLDRDSLARELHWILREGKTIYEQAASIEQKVLTLRLAMDAEMSYAKLTEAYAENKRMMSERESPALRDLARQSLIPHE